MPTLGGATALPLIRGYPCYLWSKGLEISTCSHAPPDILRLLRVFAFLAADSNRLALPSIRVYPCPSVVKSLEALIRMPHRPPSVSAQSSAKPPLHSCEFVSIRGSRRPVEACLPEGSAEVGQRPLPESIYVAMRGNGRGTCPKRCHGAPQSV